MDDKHARMHDKAMKTAPQSASEGPHMSNTFRYARQTPGAKDSGNNFGGARATGKEETPHSKVNSVVLLPAYRVCGSTTGWVRRSAASSGVQCLVRLLQ